MLVFFMAFRYYFKIENPEKREGGFQDNPFRIVVSEQQIFDDIKKLLGSQWWTFSSFITVFSGSKEDLMVEAKRISLEYAISKIAEENGCSTDAIEITKTEIYDENDTPFFGPEDLTGFLKVVCGGH